MHLPLKVKLQRKQPNLAEQHSETGGAPEGYVIEWDMQYLRLVCFGKF